MTNAKTNKNIVKQEIKCICHSCACPQRRIVLTENDAYYFRFKLNKRKMKTIHYSSCVRSAFCDIPSSETL